jgi:hypothetical protein
MEEGIIFEFVGGPIHGQSRVVPGPFNHWILAHPASEHMNAPLRVRAHYELLPCEDGELRFIYQGDE